MMGTKNTLNSCPTGYKIVDDEDYCKSTATCLSISQGSDFRIGEVNASKHLEYPRGCFVDNDNGKVYYNGPNSMGDGKDVKGTPICVVEYATKWSDKGELDGAPPATATATADTNADQAAGTAADGAADGAAAGADGAAADGAAADG